jgi:hypothetical protein
MDAADVDLHRAIDEHRHVVTRRERDERDPSGEIVVARRRRRLGRMLGADAVAGEGEQERSSPVPARG